MNFFQKVRDDMGFWILDRKAKKLPRQRTFNNLASASSVGILFEASKEDSYVTVISFAEDLVKRGLRVEMLGEVPNETFVNFISPRDGLKVFSVAEVDMLGYPKSPLVKTFVSSSFDILINLCSNNEDLCTNYIIGMSKAKLRVSPKLKSDVYADFILQLSPETLGDTEALINNIEKYLSAFSKA